MERDVMKLCERICMFGIKLEQKKKHGYSESSVQEYNELRVEVGELKPDIYLLPGLVLGKRIVTLNTLLAWTYELRDFLYAKFGNELPDKRYFTKSLLSLQASKRAAGIRGAFKAKLPHLLSDDGNKEKLSQNNDVFVREMQKKTKGEIDDINRVIARLSADKDACVRDADYEQVAVIRSKRDECIMRKRVLEGQKIVIKWELKNSADLDFRDHNLGKRISMPSAARPPEDSMADTRVGNLKRIAWMTNCNAPGIYDPKIIEEVNFLACNALGIPTAPAKDWSHNQPKKHSDPEIYGIPGCVAPDTHRVSRSAMQACAKSALEKLSGTLSHDNVAAAKQILKSIVTILD